MAQELTYLERLIDETLRPIRGALAIMEQEIAETMRIPDAPWKILNKPYDQLSEQEIVALFDIYHQENEIKPCPMCDWMARAELMRARKNKEELGG